MYLYSVKNQIHPNNKFFSARDSSGRLRTHWRYEIPQNAVLTNNTKALILNILKVNQDYKKQNSAARGPDYERIARPRDADGHSRGDRQIF